MLFSCKNAPQELSLQEIDSRISNLKQEMNSLEAIRKQKLSALGKEYVPTERTRNTDMDILEFSASDSTIIVKGKIENPKPKSKIKISLDIPYGPDLVHRISVAKDGSFDKEIHLPEPSFYKLTYNGFDTELYLEPSKTLGIIIDSLNNQGIRFVGDLVEENTFLLERENLHYKSIQEEELLAFAKQGDFSFGLSKLIEDYSTTLQDLASKKLFSKNFQDIEEKNFIFSGLLNAIKLDNKKGEEVDLDIYATCDELIEKHQLNDADKYFSLYPFRKFSFKYFENKWKTNKVHSKITSENVKEKLAVLESKDCGIKEKEFLQTDIVYEAIKSLKPYELNDLVKDFESEVKNPMYHRTIKTHYKSNIKAQTGSLAPEISGFDLAGNKVRLSDYAGKHVYIFVWASWCGPCKMEIPHYEKMIEDYADENIEFLGVAVDKDKEKWQNSFLYNNYPGTQILVKGNWNSPVIKDYNLESVPQFILIGPDGTILDINAPKPSKGAGNYLRGFGFSKSMAMNF